MLKTLPSTSNHEFGMRSLGVDPGRRRVGLALSDSELGLALPHRTLQVADTAEAAKLIAAEARLQAVGEIVVGLPLRLGGAEGPSSQRARRIAAMVQAETGRDTVLWDERLSTAAAQRSLDEVGARGTKRRKLVDQVAAAWLLQSYLDSKSEPGDGQRSTACKDRDASTPEPNGGTS